jgi:hypothetical protein
VVALLLLLAMLMVTDMLMFSLVLLSSIMVRQTRGMSRSILGRRQVLRLPRRGLEKAIRQAQLLMMAQRYSGISVSALRVM